MMLHRYYTHKSFKLTDNCKWLFTIFAVLAGRGSPLGWVYIHRLHHATSDTEKDPHSPHYDSFKFIGFRPVYDETKKINYFVVKELLTPVHLNIDKYYMLFILGYVLLLSLINVNLIFYMWALPVFVVSISQIAFNYYAHKRGYRNFATKDHSTNNKYLWPFILGDAWHNNHHSNPAATTTQIKKWELDPVRYIIRMIET
jgi:stearoyl-CoA desaturase (delta-9 desaturase)